MISIPVIVLIGIIFTLIVVSFVLLLNINALERRITDHILEEKRLRGHVRIEKLKRLNVEAEAKSLVIYVAERFGEEI